MKRIRKVLRIFIWTHIVMAIFALLFTYFAFFQVPQRLYKQALLEEPFDAIIVPGVPFEKDNWSQIMRMRVLWSHYLYRKGIAKNIIYSGGAVYTPFTESKIMALYAKQLGIPEKNIYTESNAEHSTENLYYSYFLAKEKGFNRIALATDPFQNAMLWNFKNSVDSTIKMIPVNITIVKKLPDYKISIDPKTAIVKNFRSLVERESLVERFKGTLGYKIKTTLYSNLKDLKSERKRIE